MTHHLDMGDPRELPFEKWQGTGNDFIICSMQRAMDFAKDVSTLAKAICDRHYGVGADGLLLLGHSEKTGFQMRMWNPDGSESEMCGNGLRCVGAHLIRHGLVDGSSVLALGTAKRTVNLTFMKPPEWAGADRFWVRADMGKPVTDRARIPIATPGPSPVIEEEMEMPGFIETVKFTAVNFGNPHAVIFVVDLDQVPVDKWGPAIENNTDMFPNRVNVEFVQVIGTDHVKMRVWERGAGMTLSCGSGVAAIQAACHMTGKAGDKLRVDVPGGSLLTEYTTDGLVMLSGPAVKVFSGEWS